MLFQFRVWSFHGVKGREARYTLDRLLNYCGDNRQLFTFAFTPTDTPACGRQEDYLEGTCKLQIGGPAW